MNNAATVNYVYKNYKRFIQRFRRYKPDVVEDAISRMTINLLHRKEYNITDHDGFIFNALRNELSRLKYNDRKYYIPEDGFWDYQEAPETDTVDSEKKMTQIISAIPELTKGQKEAVNNFLEYGNHTSTDNNSNTEKAQYRNAVARLKEIIK